MASNTVIAIGIIIVVVVVAGGAYVYFSGKTSPSVTNYKLTVQSPNGQGTTSPGVGSFTYASGTSVQVTASPASGWSLDHWVLDSASSGKANPIAVTMGSNHTIQAVFTQSSQTTSITIYGGEPSSTAYGFGLTSTTIKSPGPTLNFTVGQQVTLTFMNSGQFPHAFVIKAAKDPNSATVWGAVIASAASPLNPGQSGQVTFTPTQAGTYYYICPVPGHFQLGMWGMIVVT